MISQEQYEWVAKKRKVRLGGKGFNSMLYGVKNKHEKTKKKIFFKCVRSVMTYSLGTRVIRSVEDGIWKKVETDSDWVITINLGSLRLDSAVTEIRRQKKFRWFDHVVKKGDDDCVKQAWSFEFESGRKRRPRLD